MASEVTELISALRAGSMTLDEVAQRFRERQWPDVAAPESRTELELAARAVQDPGPYVPGSFDDVLAAYDRDDLTDDEYQVLAQAASEAMDADDRRGRRPGGVAGSET
jgi:hypothetical protein